MFETSNVRSKSPTPRPLAAAGSGLEKRLAIVRAAAAAFREHGFAATGMREIAQAAGLSPANLYYYFRGRDELIAFCQDYALDRMLAAARQAAEQPGDAAGRLRSVIVSQVRCMLEELDGAVAHLEVDALPAELRRKVVRKRDRYERAVRDIVADGVAAGELSPCDPKLITRAILGAVNWTARWWRPQGGTPAAEVAEAFAEYLVRGVRA